MQKQTTNIQDFGQKIGGAKKDLAQEQLRKMELITGDALISQPLSKILPRLDYVKMHSEKQLSAEKAIKLSYLYSLIESKPRATYRLRSWSLRTMETILLIKTLLVRDHLGEKEVFFTSEKFQRYQEEMQCANWPQENYTPYPYKINRFCNGGMGVVKGHLIYHKGTTVQECVDWIKENTGEKKKRRTQEFSVYMYRATGKVFITPKGKRNVVLKNDFESGEEAHQYIKAHRDELEQIYKGLRTLPCERRDWNRPRLGKDHRDGKDILPETFSAIFPFRGVEFGNWVNQIERAALLNQAYDALMDLSLALGFAPDEIALNNRLALAFGARGGGNASAHYERDRVVINLTKTKGDKGSLAHEWFHALDNYICINEGHPLLMASEMPSKLQNEKLSDVFQSLIHTIKCTDFYTRSCKCDELKSKPYWGTMVEVCARGFEKYIISKLENLGWHNDYLVNIKSLDEYGKKEYYPYPTDEEITLLSPFYDKIVECIFSQVQNIEYKQTA